MRSRKIAIITYEYPPIIGGAGIYAKELFEGLKSNNINTTLISLSANESNRVNSLKKIFLLLRSFLITWITFFKSYDTIIISDRRAKRVCSMVSSIIPNKYLLKCIIVMHGGEIDYFHNPPRMITLLNINTKFIKLLFKSRMIIVPSHSEYNIWSSFAPDLTSKIKIIHHGISEKHFYRKTKEERMYLRNKFGLSQDCFVIFSVSRLVEKKGQILLINAISSIINNTKNLYTIIGGEGEFKSKLEEIVHEKKLTSSVKFTGAIERENLVDYYNIADLFVLPSQFYESFGLVYAESLACGVPVISSNLGGVNDIIIDGFNGFKIHSLDQKALERIVLELYNNPMIMNNLSNNAINSFQNNFTIERMINSLLIETM